MDPKVKELQDLLTAAGFPPKGGSDGRWGDNTKKAVVAFQTAAALVPDGDPGPLTMKALRASSGGLAAVPDARPTGSRSWPRQSSVEAYFGKPGSPRCTAGVCRLPFPFVIAWDKAQRVSTFKCHDLVADAFTAIFADAAKHYGEALYRTLGLDLFGGCYNLRQMRGGSAYSMHSWGIAVDLDPARNALHSGRVATASTPAAVFARPEYVPFWEIVESYGALSLGRARDYDWMHFQFARL